ncbi:MAG TPA: gfo/Idh/MocA family oxidoreductase, partial [Fibrobacteria bacterium]|nr:gfo/Idh/MocA family oxidoreductase [Fibrobacteria bacterium]
LKYSLLVDYRTGDIVIPKLPQVEALKKLVDHAYRSISGSAATHIGGDAGERIVALVEAAQQSMAAGGLPVALA